MARKHKEPLPNIGRKQWPPGEYRRSAEDGFRNIIPEEGPGKRWDGRVKHIDALGNYFSPTFDYPESISNDGNGEKVPHLSAPKPKKSHRGRDAFVSKEDY